jgi:hypothetical protein
MRDLPVGEAVNAMGRTGLGCLTPALSRVPRFCPHQPTARLMAPRVAPAPRHEAALGRAGEPHAVRGVRFLNAPGVLAASRALQKPARLLALFRVLTGGAWWRPPWRTASRSSGRHGQGSTQSHDPHRRAPIHLMLLIYRMSISLLCPRMIPLIRLMQMSCVDTGIDPCGLQVLIPQEGF